MMNAAIDEPIEGIKVFETDENITKKELGSKRVAIISEEHDESTVWDALSILTSNVGLIGREGSKVKFSREESSNDWEKAK